MRIVDHVRVMNSRGNVFVLGLLSTLIAVVLAVIGQVLGMDSEETRLAARAYAPITGSQWAGAPSQADRIAVVLIDDEALEQSGQVWPATYRFHARIARELQAVRPPAVFFDIAFVQSRDDPSLDLLVRELCELRRSGTTVFLAGLRDERGALRLLPRLRDATVESAAPGERVPCVQVVGIEYDPDAVDHTAWSYPLDLDLRVADDCRRGARPVEAHQPTAAAAFATLALTDGQHLVRCPMALVWSRAVAREGVGWHEPRGADGRPAASYCRADWKWWEPALRPMPVLADAVAGWERGTAERPLCVPYETVRAARLLAGESVPMLHERIVLVGTDTKFALDRVLSPLHGSIPGVYLHATALDNLLSFGTQVRREPAHLGGAARWWWGLVSLFVVFVVAVVVRLVSRALQRIVRRAPARRAVNATSLHGSAIRVVSKLLGFTLYRLLKYVSVTLLGVILVALLLPLTNVSLLGAVWLVQLAALADLFDLPEQFVEWWKGSSAEGGTGERRDT